MGWDGMQKSLISVCTEFLEKKGTIPKCMLLCFRTEPDFFDSSGQTFWRLKSYDDEYAFLMQGNSQNTLASFS
jgi:hypothetical protein